MKLSKRLLTWRDDRVRLAHLRAELEDHDAAFEAKVDERYAHRNTQGYYALLDLYLFERRIIEGQLEVMATRRLMTQALSWGVPVPDRPHERAGENEMWNFDETFGHQVLSDRGKAFLRREVLTEMEMRNRIWLPWIAVGISILSLAVAVLKP